MSSRPRTMLTRALHSVFLAACLSTGGVGASHEVQARSRTSAPAPIPFTTLPSRSPPVPATDARAVQRRQHLAPAVRALTAGEIQLATALFGDKLRLDDVRIVLSAQDDEARFSAATAGDGHSLRIYNSKHFSADYSSETNAALFGSFVNQLAGLVQQRTRGWEASTEENGDLYTLDTRRFADYSLSQQRAIVEDYALRFLHPARMSYWLTKAYNGDSSITDPHLIDVVERAFPSARDARIAFQAIETRPLTDNEISVIRMIFGDQLDTAGVRVHLCPRMFRDVAGAVSGSKDVYFYGRNRMADYTTGTTSQRAIFLHEMVHIWQFQTERRYTVVVNDQYEYTIEAGARFESYNIEQQAAMVEDYALAYMNPHAPVRYLREKYTEAEIPARMLLVTQTVEARFPAARAVRLAAEARAAEELAAKAEKAQPAQNTQAPDITPPAQGTTPVHDTAPAPDSTAHPPHGDDTEGDKAGAAVPPAEPPPPPPQPVERVSLPFATFTLQIPAPVFAPPPRVTLQLRRR